jgi:hypothetical protein
MPCHYVARADDHVVTWLMLLPFEAGSSTWPELVTHVTSYPGLVVHGSTWPGLVAHVTSCRLVLCLWHMLPPALDWGFI